MTGDSVALDTNAAIGFLAGEPQWTAVLSAFNRPCMPVIVAGELRYGAMNSGRPEANLAVVDDLIHHCSILDVDANTSLVYASVRLALKRRGRPVPENDVWIAALCCQHLVPLATRDAHFEHIEGLQIVQPIS